VPAALPYKIATLVYCINPRGQLLLLHRKRPPNRDLYSPIGGKLEQAIGESPYACALREIQEEIDVTLTLAEIALLGIVSEAGHEGQQHWLMFCFEVLKPIDFPPRDIPEGRLEWFHLDQLDQLTIPKTDRDVIWPMVRRTSRRLNPGVPPAPVFSVHIDCAPDDALNVTYEFPLIAPV
jgi:8-oxo-dGTP diphosphatase